MFAFILIVVVGTSLWVFFDARSIVAEQPGGTVAGTRPFTWALGCLLLWIVIFPYYLAQRQRHTDRIAVTDLRRAVACPHCDARYHLDVPVGGKTYRCSTCRKAFTVAG